MLIKAVNSYVSEEGRLATGTIGTVAVAFAHITPVIDSTIVLIDIAIVVAESSCIVFAFAQGAVAVGSTPVLLAWVFVVIGEIVIPHAANKIAAVVVKFNLYRLVINLFLYDSFAIILVECVCGYLKLRKLN